MLMPTRTKKKIVGGPHPGTYSQLLAHLLHIQSGWNWVEELSCSLDFIRPVIPQGTTMRDLMGPIFRNKHGFKQHVPTHPMTAAEIALLAEKEDVKQRMSIGSFAFEFMIFTTRAVREPAAEFLIP
jgi:hypothetical protein